MLHKAYKLGTAMLIALIATITIEVLVSPYSAFAKECDNIRESVFRLHIIPNSNSQQDQQIKLIVRDRMLSLDKELLGEATSKLEAKRAAIKNLDYIKETVSNTLISYGFSYQVKVEICNMYFPTREYDNFTLPAGNYDAVRITLGAGKGYNWWCVLYPAMCIPAATKKQQAELPDEQQELIENADGKYKAKFAVVELFQRIANKIKQPSTFVEG